MPEIWFYHLTGRRLEGVLPALLERMRKADWRAVVRCGTQARVEDLNRVLWIYRDESFLPHGAASDGAPARQPIYLTAGSERPNAAEMLFLVDRAAASLDELSPYRRVALIFDGRDEEALREARAFWKMATGAGRAAVYWAETPSGWEKKAESAAADQGDE